jgi:predicted RecB family nuclease
MCRSGAGTRPRRTGTESKEGFRKTENRQVNVEVLGPPDRFRPDRGGGPARFPPDVTATRHNALVDDIEIRPKNSSFAKQCPQRVQLDVLQPCEPLPDPPFLQMLYRAGNEHEDDTFALLFDGVEGAVVIEAEDPNDREWQTLQAVKDGALVIAGSRLPIDHRAQRVGQPDLLVRHGEGYLPIEVKSHKALERVRKAGTGAALVSDVTTPFFDAAAADVEHNARKHVGDLMQLAHYRALLEAAGMAAPDCFAAGVCGTEGVIVWHDLAAPVLDPPEYLDDPPAGHISAMERYDTEFAHRLGIFRAAEAHFFDEVTPLLAEPIVCDQCDMCRWREWCGDRLEEVADLSLIAGVGVGRRALYKAHGIDDLHDLAALDWRTAELVRGKVDVEGLGLKAVGRPATTPLADVIANRPKQVEVLSALGLQSVGDLETIDTKTLDVCTAGAPNAATQIELARARVGESPAYRKRGVDTVTVPRADIEVDVDMENTNDGCYLWGALVTDRRGEVPTVRYMPFVTWDPDIEAGELIAFKDFWSWFSDLRAEASGDGASFKAYCYSKSAEQGQMTRVADRLGLRDDVDEFWASNDWVDLLEVVRAQLITGRSMGLKETAPLSGFAWRSGDSGGTLAMVKYDQAIGEDTGPAGRAAAQEWILEYNEDDVRATAALREWLGGPAGELPSIESAGD